MYSLDYGRFLDQVYGGWFGKCLGGAVGAPVEGVKKVLNVTDFARVIRADLANDDLDLQILWLEE